MKIIVDAMGGDNAPQAPVMGAVQANGSMVWISSWWGGGRPS